MRPTIETRNNMHSITVSLVHSNDMELYVPLQAKNMILEVPMVAQIGKYQVEELIFLDPKRRWTFKVGECFAPTDTVN